MGAQDDKGFVRGKQRFLTNKERHLITRTFSNKGKCITRHDVREAVFHNEEFREMFEELIESDYQGSKVCGSNTVKQN